MSNEITNNEIAARVIKIVAKQLGVVEAEVKNESSFTADLGASGGAIGAEVGGQGGAV